MTIRRGSGAYRAGVPDQPVVCAVCGASAGGSEPPLTWSTQLGRRGVELVCDRCTRENVRAIEGKLESEWW
jgi:hypothetical protein